MTTQDLDCKGLPCPQPVLRCKQYIETYTPEIFALLVDNDAAKENVTRFLGTQGYAVEAQASGDGIWRLAARRQGAAPAAADCACEVMSPAQVAQVGAQKICVFLTAETIGLGDDTLGGKLMGNFLGTLPELGSELWRLILVNGAVKLAVHDSPVLPQLQKLADSGVSILVCGTCLDFFGLLEKKAVGQTTNMLDVVTSLQLATKVVRP